MIITSIIAMIAITQSNEIRVENMNDASIHCASIAYYNDAIECMRDAYHAYKYDNSMRECENNIDALNCIYIANAQTNELSYVNVDNINYYLTLNDRVINA